MRSVLSHHDLPQPAGEGHVHIFSSALDTDTYFSEGADKVLHLMTPAPGTEGETRQMY